MLGTTDGGTLAISADILAAIFWGREAIADREV
jgi:hypothetical protein